MSVVIMSQKTMKKNSGSKGLIENLNIFMESEGRGRGMGSFTRRRGY